MYHKFKNAKYSIQKKGGQLKFSNSLSDGHSKFTVPAQIKGTTDKTDPSVQVAISRLKHESHDSWPAILQSWSITHALGFKVLKIQDLSRIQPARRHPNQAKSNISSVPTFKSGKYLIVQTDICW
ncbi:uncharacterized protein LOC117173752 [Belonocnema kinseyi]|uniref:uncharacterized protein LOC117173752 n=1 Tax=Belonocnema kinseyi TaxID=2817044 RepID=UPI00143DF769|nr:uncharacterized protein LOC117173752 [Belonocnema kinseyi]